MLSNTPQLDALVDAMADAVAVVLNITDSEVSEKDRLVHLLHRERNYIPDKERIQKVMNLMDQLDFTRHTDALASEMAEHAHRLLEEGDGGFALHHYAQEEVYNFQQRFQRKVGGTFVSETVVGGIGLKLHNTVSSHIEQWLHLCDSRMTIHYEQEFHRANSEAVDHTIALLANAISKQICLVEKQNVTTKSLEAIAKREVERAHFAALDCKRLDLMALQVILDICEHGVDSERAHQIGRTEYKRLDRLLKRAPVEIGIDAAILQLDMLHPVCRDDVPFETKLHVLRTWINTYGSLAQLVVTQAIAKITAWKPEHEKGFVEVVTLKRSADKKKQLALPDPLFVQLQSDWFLRHRDAYSVERRSGLDFEGRRIVRIISLVIELNAFGEFERGVVSPDMILPVAYDACMHARYASTRLNHQLQHLSFGFRLVSVSRNLRTPQSHLTDSVHRLMCALSHFSLLQIKTVFHEDSKILPDVQQEFTSKVQTLLYTGYKPPVGSQLPHTQSLPVGYTRFALDALALLLPTIEAMRERVNVSVFTASNPLSDLLRTIERVRNWHPVQGTLTLTHNDLKRAHAQIERMLKHLASQRLLVRHHRPMLPDGQQASRYVYEFDTNQLLAALLPSTRIRADHAASPERIARPHRQRSTPQPSGATA